MLLPQQRAMQMLNSHVNDDSKIKSYVVFLVKYHTLLQRCW